MEIETEFYYFTIISQSLLLEDSILIDLKNNFNNQKILNHSFNRFDVQLFGYFDKNVFIGNIDNRNEVICFWDFRIEYFDFLKNKFNVDKNKFDFIFNRND